MEETLDIRRAAWDEVAAGLLLDAAEGNPASLEPVRLAVTDGLADLYIVEDTGRPVLAFALTMEGMEGVVMIGGGAREGGGLFDQARPMIEDMLRRKGANSIRVETYRAGMLKRLVDSGYRPLHVSMWKPL